jgi:hypothetical protein
VAEKENNNPDSPTEKKGLELNLIANYEQPFPTLYANYAVVRHTPTELCIDFCLMAHPLKVNVGKKSALVPVISRIMLPTQVATGLIKALQDQIKRQKTDQKTLVLSIGEKEK